MIESWHVREALRSRLGSSLVDEPGFADPLAAVLSSYVSPPLPQKWRIPCSTSCTTVWVPPCPFG